ncbi:hypothetical protein CDO52_24785 [Nocardiopsis gilva YIM 90087]|uniref:Guanylate cyclase domain-containing protein n=1 Tax=Nocardiopsis gilva YIM 90087 TaxID=1235441 RepID=A0A223SC33_9ACTN|nr:hypothetical protein [Nocardiopsis gilva]ASU85589.1 hypothetical protein CDO52_24785 [Nocardiopsis gilva YIM 90087]
MAEIPRRVRRTSIPMPPYRAVLAVDAEKYSRTSSYNQRILSNTVRDALEEAFRGSGLEHLWRNASFPQTTGDGYVVGVQPEHLPLLIHPLLGELQAVLGEIQPGLAFEDRSLRLRLRAAIGLGPLPDSGGDERGDGVGTAMNETHRLLDAPALRAGLADSDPEITFLAAGITRRVYEDAVLGGYVGLAPRHFHETEVDLPDKEYRAEAYLYIPQPSLRPPEARGTGGSAPRETAQRSGGHDPDSSQGQGQGQSQAPRPGRGAAGAITFEAIPDA